MSAEFICDGCGKREVGKALRSGGWSRPSDWYERTDEDGTQTACSRECIRRVAEKSGKTDLVLPI